MNHGAIKVVLADDHEILREGLKVLLNAEPDIEVVGEATDADAAHRLTCEMQPDVLVLDISMPRGGGAAAAERVHADCSHVKIVALTVHEEPQYVSRLLAAGAVGYVLKRSAAADLVRAVRAVIAGDTYIDPSIAHTVVSGFLEAEAATQAVPDDGLSDRERDVLVRIAQGFSNKEIAAALGLSVKTVESYKSRVAAKLELRTRVDIVRYATRRGWLSA